MTEHRRVKREIRSRMAQTGEKYTDARRALLARAGAAEGAGSGGTQRPRPAARPPRAPRGGRFTDQAYNAILLAQDEARMLRQPKVEPEHLLLAAARRGNVEQLLASAGISAGAIYDALVRAGGLGADLVLGPVPRSAAGEETLGRAALAAAERGAGPSTQHLLLGLPEQSIAAALLRELGVVDAAALVDAAHPVTRAPMKPGSLGEPSFAESARAAMARTPASPGPIPPVFERFTVAAANAVQAAVASARELQNRYVEPAHLLLGVLDAPEGAIAALRTRHARPLDAALARAVDVLTRERRPVRATDVLTRERRPARATDIFTAPARQLVAEDVLAVAERLGGRSLSAGHLLLAVLESKDEKIVEILGVLPDREQIAAEVAEAPGDEAHA